ncbi:MAG: hypothetical protein ACRD3T_13840, partial [Terriglobia bacterium]
DATDMNNIDNAIASCPASEVVMLETGTYTVTGGLTFGTVSNVTLRGAGPDKTKLNFTGLGSHGDCGASPDVCFFGNAGWANPSTGSYAGSHVWTAGYAQGSTVLTLDSTSGLAVGQVIILDQRDDAVGTLAGTSGATESGSTVTITTSIPHGYTTGQTVGVGEMGVSGYNGRWTIASTPTSTTFTYTDTNTGLANSGGGYTTVDTGGMFVSDVTGITISEGADDGRVCPDTDDPACVAGEISERNQSEVKIITAVNGNQITISPPVYETNWRSANAPGLWWTGTTYDVLDGIESMTLDYTNDTGTDNNGGIEFYRTYECWAKNIRSINGDRNHIWIRAGSARDEVVDSYFFGSKQGGEEGYGIEIFESSEDDLIQNNICQHVDPCVMSGGLWGTVVAYNYSFDSGYNTPGWLMPLLSENHDFAAMNLYEGNDVPFPHLDSVHGTGSTETSFRNRFRGQDTPVKTNGRLAAEYDAFNRFANAVGNVMGTVGAETGYQTTTQGTFDQYVYALDVQSEGTGLPNDNLVHESLLRWGNYDTATGAVRWCGNSSDPGWSTTCASTSEIPTSPFTFINGNAVPSSTTLPVSFYLSSQPSFWTTAWGTPHWPAIGPDVTGGTAPDGVGGYSYSIPVQLCQANTPIDSAYQQTFTVTGASWSSGTVTLTIGTNTLAPYTTVAVAGVSPSGYNGTFEVTAETGTTISYALTNNPGTYTSGGTVNYPNILLFNAANCYPAAYGGQPDPPTDLVAAPH